MVLSRIVRQTLNAHKDRMSFMISGTGLVPDWAHEWARQSGIPRITLIPQCYAQYAELNHEPVQIEGKDPRGEVLYYLLRIDTLLVFGGGEQTQLEKSLAPEYDVTVIECDITPALLQLA
jgi:hypothetical protein